MRVRDHFRAHGRKNVSLPASLRDQAQSVEEEARIRNLGLGGACVELAPGPARLAVAEVLMRVDSTLLLEVVAPSLWDPLVLRGRVAWSRRSSADKPSRIGLRFEQQDEGNLFALFQLLGAHAYNE